MQKNTPIRKIAHASLALLISASHVVGAMDIDVVDSTGAGKGGASGQLRDHDYYKAELQKLEESTRRIHEEVDRILAEFRKNMEEYRKHTRGMGVLITIPEEIQVKVEQEGFGGRLGLNIEAGQLGLAEEEEFLFAQQASLQTAEKEGVAGPREIEGWKLEDVKDDGNCFYHSVVHQMELVKHDFLKEVSDKPSHERLRFCIEGKGARDRQWAGGKHFKEFVKKFDDIILAVMDTRSPKDGYVCYYLGDNKEVITHVPDMGPVPGGKSIIKIATTGTHYMPVINEPSDGFRKIEIGEIVTEKPQTLGKILMEEPILEQEETQELEDNQKTGKEAKELEEKKAVEEEQPKEEARKKKLEERERVEKEEAQQKVNELLKLAGIDLQASDNIAAAAHYLDINKVRDIKELESIIEDVKKDLETIIKFQVWKINNKPTIDHIKHLKNFVSTNPGLQKDVQTLVAKYISSENFPPRTTPLITYRNTNVVSYYIEINKIETLKELKVEDLGKKLEAISKFQDWKINDKPTEKDVNLLKDFISKYPSLGEGMQKAVAMYIKDKHEIPAVVVNVTELEINPVLPDICKFTHINFLPDPDKHKDEYKKSLKEEIEKVILKSMIELSNGNFVVFDTMKQYEDEGIMWTTTYKTNLGKIFQYK